MAKYKGLTRQEVIDTGLPFYMSHESVPVSLISKTQAKQIGKPINKSEKPAAYLWNNMGHWFFPLYSRTGEKIKYTSSVFNPTD